MQLILGSQSPRRKEILSYFALPFKQATPPFDEESVPFNGNPVDYVSEISGGKAEALSKTFHDALIITADTTVYREGKIYGKPATQEEAFKYLSELVGRWHSVYTGITVRQGTTVQHAAEETRVLFNPLTPEEIRHYHTKLHWSDKAGGYAIQMAGGLIVKKIDGCYYNVMGLPINTLRTLLQKFGIELWEYLK